ncbi:MAG TPA: HAD-IIB family hydrolase [Sedimenticola thiotaurini]|uniref:sucrose-phosphate synthase n=1 Tax=Sedimenticola thiotaurini TaxID=1543721 RepID=A0A831W8S4_9GAMM|nr:HAD-IIB family hydrolase [Sedimenticola thiotaurini]
MSERGEGTYLLLISIHGLIRGRDLELGRDADTGGQTKYVIDLARALAGHEGIGRVDLVTRRVVDPAVSDDYAVPLEPLSDKARIVRIDAGPGEYIPKEQLWDHLDSFMDNLLNWLNEQPRLPDLVHSHYADSGYVGVRLSNLLGIPLIHTGHSLGRDKRERLLAKGLTRIGIETVYNMGRRIDAEEEVLANADLVITSTHNEIEEQYGLYNYYDPARMVVIPPGTDLTQFHPPRAEERIAFADQLKRFLDDPGKPLILSLSRPDERKNILTLIEAFGESDALQEAANLLIVAGSRDDIRDMDSGAQSVLTNILLLIDSYDLYGRVAIPKSHRADEVPDIYRLAAASGGVFINPALTEPFGLTILEAAASGLPVVATENGGPVDIIANCRNGILVDPLDKAAITSALLKLLGDREVWRRAADHGIDGVRRHYSWKSHADIYLTRVAQLSGRHQPIPAQRLTRAFRYRDRAIFTDLDQNLVGNPDALQRFVRVIRENRKCVIFGIATGRRIDSALALMKKHRIPMPDVLISSLGTRIHYGTALTEDDWWADHIDHHWNPQRVRRALKNLDGLQLQSKIEQTGFKLSYYYDPQKAPPVEEIIALIRQEELTANVSCSFGQFLDIVPSRASKGQALRYVSQRLEIPLENILVAGGSGADEDMMRGNTLAVVVGNRHHEELSQLVDQESIYFADQPHALGILEAIEHYDFFNACQVPVTENE